MVSSLRQRELGRLLGFCGWIKQALVYWTSPSLHSAHRRLCESADSSVSEICALLANGNHSDHTQGRFSNHKGRPVERLRHSLSFLWILQVTRFASVSVLYQNSVHLFSDHFMVSILFPLFLSFTQQPQSSFSLFPSSSSSSTSFLCVFPWCSHWNARLLKVIYICYQAVWRPSLLCETDWVGEKKKRLNTSSQRDNSTVFPRDVEMISEIRTVKTVSSMTPWQRQAADSR